MEIQKIMDDVAVLEVELELTPEMMADMEREAEKAQQEKLTILSGLAGDIESKFRERSGRRQTKEREWIESTRLHLGSLSTGKDYNTKLRPLDSISTSNKPRHNLVKSKCDVAVAKSVSSQFAGGDTNWNIAATPVPEGDPKLMELAAREMEKEIKDQLEEERYGYKCRLAMQDRVILGTGVLKGPAPSKDAKLFYTITQGPDGAPFPIPEYRILNRPVIDRVDPWMFFPDDTVSDIREASDTIQLHPMSKLQLAKLKKNPGFFPEAIDSLLESGAQEYTNGTFSEYASLTDAGQNFLRNKYPVCEYHGPISMSQLGALGIEPSYEPLGEMYFGEVWACQGQVLRVELEAITGLYELPYMVCPWEKDPNSIFGFGLPQLIKDPQRIAQVTLDMILENASLSSGPIGIINKSFIEPFDGDWTLYPNKLFGTTDFTLSSVDQAMKFFNVPNLSADLFPILQFAREVAQEESTVPFLGSMQSPSVGSDSATGLGILQQQETTVSDFKAEEWDDMVTEVLIRRMYHWNMQYNPKPNIIGDFDVDVKSSTEYRKSQLASRDLEKVSVEAAQNPELAKVINIDQLTRARLATMHIPDNGIIKTPEEVAADQEAAAQAPPPPDPVMLKHKSDMRALDVKEKELEFKQAQMQFEMQFQQRREEMNHAERMGANHMRELEVQARVNEAMAEREIELMKLAQKENSDKAWIMSELHNSQLQADSQKFQAGLDSQSKFREQALKAAELRYAEKSGKGI